MAPWKNRICSTTMKLRKSLVKPVMRQKTCNRVVRFFCPRSLCTTTHLMLFSERPPIYTSCMAISGGRTCMKSFFISKKHAKVQLQWSPHPIFHLGGHPCMWGQTVDILKHPKFQVNQFRVLERHGADNDPPPLTWRIALTTVYALMCYTVMPPRRATECSIS